MQSFNIRAYNRLSERDAQYYVSVNEAKLSDSKEPSNNQVEPETECERARPPPRTQKTYTNFYSKRCSRPCSNYLKYLGDGTSNAEGKAYKFSNGDPNPNSFPYEKVQVTLKNGSTFEMKDAKLANSLSYSTCKGYGPLLSLLKEFQDKLHGKQSWTERDLTTTAGSQGALSQLLDVIVSDGEPVLVEAPVYPGFISILRLLDAEFLEVEPDESGFSPLNMRKLLEDRKAKNLKMPKILYLNPTGGNPTGIVLSLERRRDIYELACEYDFLILEDDPYYLLTFQNDRPVSFLSMDRAQRVIRFDSFSKVMGAGFRVGYVTAPTEIIQKLNGYKGTTTYAPPLCQVILYETLAEFGFEGFMQHIDGIKQIYAKNRECMLQALETHLKEYAEWKDPEGAMFVWVKIRSLSHISQGFIEKCMRKNIFVAPGFAFYAADRISPRIRLAYSIVSEEDIKEGVEMLAELIRQEILLNETEINFQTQIQIGESLNA